MVKVCECCGHPLPEYDTLSGLTELQQRLFTALERSGRVGLTRAEIFQKLYGDDPHGGPDSLNVVNVHRAKMQYALRKHNIKIVATKGWGTRWRLEKI
jgi:hypothetical protein